jgi:Flp pilus assembly CpaE family ATPase
VAVTVAVVEPASDSRRRLADALAEPVVAVASLDELAARPAAGPYVLVVGPSLDSVEVRAALSEAAMQPVAVVGVSPACTVAELRRVLCSGVEDLIPLSATDGQLRHAVRRAALARMQAVPPPSFGGVPAVDDVPHPTEAMVVASGHRLLAVFAPKGGSGGTTVSVNLAAALAGTVNGADSPPARPVVVVDADFQFGDVALALGVEPGPPLPADTGDADDQHTLVEDPEYLDRLLVAVPGWALKILSAPVDPVTAERITPSIVLAALAALRHLSSAVVVDLPSRLDDLVVEVAMAADHLMVVTATDLAAVKDTGAAIDVLHRLGLPQEQWSLVCNRVGEVAGLRVEELEERLGRRVLASIPDDPLVRRAARRGVPVLTKVPPSPAGHAFVGLASLLGSTSLPPDRAGSGVPLLRRMLGPWAVAFAGKG